MIFYSKKTKWHEHSRTWSLINKNRYKIPDAPLHLKKEKLILKLLITFYY